jgi:hypothetical protein
MQFQSAMRTLGSGRSKGWSRGVKRSVFEISNSQPNWMGRLAGPHIPRLVCRQGPPDFESGIAT